MTIYPKKQPIIVLTIQYDSRIYIVYLRKSWQILILIEINYSQKTLVEYNLDN